MNYVDGVLLAAPKANKDVYKSYAERMAALFKRHGALAVVDCWGDDVPEGKLNSMRTAVLLKPDEAVVLGWISWPSKQVRDEAWEKIMQDPEMTGEEMPYDGARMIFGGFEVVSNV